VGGGRFKIGPPLYKTWSPANCTTPWPWVSKNCILPFFFFGFWFQIMLLPIVGLHLISPYLSVTTFFIDDMSCLEEY